jgi:hypothetical protein
MSHRVRKPIVALLAICSLFAVIAVARSDSSPGANAAAKPIKLEEATMIIELNSTDGDAGLQAFLDGEPWRSMSISSPDGRKLVDVRNKGRLRNFGLTELFTESNEPPFDELPLRKFKRRFPEGRYRFSGKTIEGRKLVGKAKLSHDIPGGPKIISPTEGATIARDGAVASWVDPVAESGGVEISGYRAIVEREDPLRVFEVELPASVTSVTIPPEYLQAGAKHKLEVQAIERSGNQTISELEFRVG